MQNLRRGRRSSPPAEQKYDNVIVLVHALDNVRNSLAIQDYKKTPIHCEYRIKKKTLVLQEGEIRYIIVVQFSYVLSIHNILGMGVVIRESNSGGGNFKSHSLNTPLPT